MVSSSCAPDNFLLLYLLGLWVMQFLFFWYMTPRAKITMSTDVQK